MYFNKMDFDMALPAHKLENELIDLPQPNLKLYDIMDIEASGFGRGSYPVEVGVCLADGHCHCFLIHPEPDWEHWTEEGERTHGIPRELLLERGLPPREVALQLNKLLEGKVLYSDAWGQDQSWLMKLYDAAGLWPNYKLESIRALMSERELESYHSCFNDAEETLTLTRHRASSDARLIQQALALVKNPL